MTHQGALFVHDPGRGGGGGGGIPYDGPYGEASGFMYMNG